MVNLPNFVVYQFLKIAAKAFETGDFLNISQGFEFFEAHFLMKSFLMKKRVATSASITATAFTTTISNVNVLFL